MSGTWGYDGSLEGLMVLSRRAYAELAAPDAVASALAEEGELFALLGPSPYDPSPRWDSPEELAAEAEAAGAELRAFSGELFDLVIRIWMSEESLEAPLLRLCAQAGRRGEEALSDFRDSDARLLAKASRRVNHEIHRLQGFARFSPRADGLYSAPLEPDHNVAAALLPHFSRRFRDEDFAIVDLRRRLAFARRGGRFESAAGEAARDYLPEPTGPRGASDPEAELWKRYFKAAENPARRNPRLQRSLMPRRYWRYLTELEGGPR
jgi:probable DNA metabolism protein